jgi:hypothetical protein
VSNVAENQRSKRLVGDAAVTGVASRVFLTSLLACLTFFALAFPISADGKLSDPLLPREHSYQEYFDSKPVSFSFQVNEFDSFEASTAYPNRSLLEHSMPLGKTGLIFRVKAKPNPRRLIKLEIRF